MRDKITDFFQELYQFELARKDRIHSQTMLFLVLFTITGNFLVFYSGVLDNFHFRIWHIPIFYLPILIGGTFLGISLFWFYRCFHGGTYGYLAEPKKLYDYYQKATKEVGSEAPQNFINNLEKQYVFCANHNRQVNIARVRQSRNSLLCSFFAIVFFVLSAPGYLSITYSRANSDERHKHTNKEKTVMIDEEKNESDPVDSEAPQEASSLEFPDPQFIKESTANERQPSPPPPPEPKDD